METLDEARVLIIYTGGTIGMVHSPNGYVPLGGFLESNLRSQSRFHDPSRDSLFSNSSSVELYNSWSISRPTSPDHSTTASAIPMLVHTATGSVSLHSLVTPKIATGRRIRYCILEYPKLIDSAEVESSDWLRIAGDIELNYASFDSFLVLHGTDTMAYTASALSFLLEDLGKTVIITGAQIPLAELFNDSLDNLLGSLVIAASFVIPEVCLFFNHKLLRGNRSIKSSSDDFNAFLSPNLPPLATIGITVELTWSRILRPGVRPFRAHKSLSSQVATLRLFPGISGNTVRAFLASDIRAVVLSTYGAGNAPRTPALLSAFREAAERGVVIVNVTQCAFGGVSPDTYENGRLLTACGITSGGDMTVEAALAKCAYLLSKDLSTDAIRQLISQPLRGELTLPNSIPTSSTPLEEEDRLRELLSKVVACSLSVTATKVTEALVPILISQAAAKSGPLLSTLIDSFASPSSSHILNESVTAALQSPLMLAVIASDFNNVQILIAGGASVHQRDAFHHSSLYYAIKSGCKPIIMALIEAGAFLGETEIASGEIGLEFIRCEKEGLTEMVELWNLAGREEIARSRRCLIELVGS